MKGRLKDRLVWLILLTSIISCSNDDDLPNGGGDDTTGPAILSVEPIDAFHVEVTFSEPVTRSSAEYEAHYQATFVAFAAVMLQEDQRTVTLTSSVSMQGKVHDLTVTGVSDLSGNVMGVPIVESFTGSDTPDTTSPTVLSLSPASGAREVSVGTPVVIRFSEAVLGANGSGVATWLSNGVEVGHLQRFENFEYQAQDGGNAIWLMPINALEPGAVQTIRIVGVQDFAGNTMQPTHWSFTTTDVVDHTGPTLVSSDPADNATNVSVSTTLSLTFSEPMNEVIDLSIQLTPVAAYPNVWTYWGAAKTWSNGGRTVTISLYEPLHDNEQYTLTISPQQVLDLARNQFQGYRTVTFTTGKDFHEGSISGLVLGDSGTAAENPGGALVLAFDHSNFGDHVRGSAIVANDSSYTVDQLRDDEYSMFALLDSNHDGRLDPAYGDAFGMYGVWERRWTGAEYPTIEVEGRVDVNYAYIALFDPSTILGRVIYDGSQPHTWDVKVGLFRSEGFAPTSVPVKVFQASSKEYPWYFNSFIDLNDGHYHVGAFMDLNHDGRYDLASEPADFYGGSESPTDLDVIHGNDFLDIRLTLASPLKGMAPDR